MGVELLQKGRRTDGRTDITNLILAFPNFAKAPKKTEIYLSYTQN